MKTLIVTAPCFLDGKPLETGEILKLEDAKAYMLLTGGRVKLFDGVIEEKPVTKKAAKKAAKKKAK